MSITVQLTDFKPFEAQSFSWGTRQPPTAGMPGAQAQVDDCQVTKHLDENSAQLKVYAAEGKPIAEARMTLKKDDKPYVVAILSAVFIASYNFSSGGDGPNETIALNFGKVEYEY